MQRTISHSKISSSITKESMKRALNEFTEGERQAASLQLEDLTRQPLDPTHPLYRDSMIILDNSFEFALSPSCPVDLSVETVLPRAFVARALVRHFNGIAPRKFYTSKYSYSTLSTLLDVTFQWKITSMNVARAALGARLDPRSYPNPDGLCNFDPTRGTIGGGRFVPEVNEDSPLTINYAWLTGKLKLSLRVVKERAEVGADRHVTFKPLRV